MSSLSDVARHWSRATENGKGIGLKADVLDALNAIGVGELIQMKAAEEQREACAARIRNSTVGANTGSHGISSGTEASDPPSSRSFGTTKRQDVTVAAQRARRASNRRKPS